jgi:UDP-N-acetylbacillosamine N-acetyltransferase
MEKIELVIYGASGHGKVIKDIAKRNGYKNIIFIDDGDNEYLNYESFKNKYKCKNIVLGIGDNFIREKIFNKLKQDNYNIITLIDPSVVIGDNVEIGEGTVIMPNVVINSESKIANGVILNTSSVIEHEDIIEDFVHISPNVALAGNVKVGKATHIGIGSSVIQNIIIGKNCIIGAGSVVICDIKNNKKVAGNPVHELKKAKNEQL